MKRNVATVTEYLETVPAEQLPALKKLRSVIKKNLPKGFQEVIGYGMIGYVVPHSLYKPGYHCDPDLPLPFVNLAAQKKFIGVYHMGLYSDPQLLAWFQQEYKHHCSHKLDMGKSCIRLKKYDDIPYDLIGAVMKKITVKQWIALYENSLRR